MLSGTQMSSLCTSQAWFKQLVRLSPQYWCSASNRRNGLQQVQRLQMVNRTVPDLALQAHKTLRRGGQQSVV